MPLNRSVFTTVSSRLRPASPRCRGGASSLLRLSTSASSRLPTAPDLSAWISHAASVLMPVTGPLTAFPAFADTRQDAS